jgi:hypothetical protein
MGRPTSYTPEIAEEICDRMIEGESLNKICSQEGMPSRVTVYRWLDGNEAFRHKYARAREAQAHYYFELIRDIAFDDKGDFYVEDGKTVADHARVQRARLKVDALKWTSSKLLPRVYGDKPLEEQPKNMKITWLVNTGVQRHGDPALPDEPPPPPKQLTYQKPELPTDLTERDWSVMLEVLELVKRTVPFNDERPPEEIFGVMKQALLAHFRDGCAD